MLKECLSKMLLIDNPFRITPTRRPTIWAGMKDLKGKFDQIIKNSLIVSPSRLIVNWGDWGTGKTHAGKYFTHEANIRPLIEELDVQNPLCIFITLPRPIRAGQAIIELYQSIMENITFNKISSGIRKVYRQMNYYFIEKEGLTEETAISRIKKSFIEILDSEDLAEIFIRLASITQESERILIRKYLWGQESSGERTTLKVASSINSLTTILRTLGGLTRILTFYSESVPEPAFSEVFLWIDETEGLLELKAGDTVSLLTFFRDILDYAPNNLTILLNITMRAAEVRDIEALLGPGVFERVYKNMEFTEFLNTELALEFVKQLLNNNEYRPEEYVEQLPDEYYPFTSEGLEVIIDDFTPNLTPRRLNDNCSTVLEIACHKNVIKNIGDRISTDFIRESLTI